MERKNPQQLPDTRQLIHDLTIKKRTSSGLSPPEEELLLRFEEYELNLPEQFDDCPGFIITGGTFMDSIHDPIEAVYKACGKYKSALMWVINSDNIECQRDTFHKAAIAYKKSLKAAIRYLREDLMRMEKEVNEYDS